MGNSLRILAALGFLILELVNPQALAEEWHVDISQTVNSQDGASWETAFQHLEDAIQAAITHPDSAHLIKVAQGVYRPGQTEADPDNDDRTAAFVLQPQMDLEGGYRGGTVSPDDRDIVNFETILSGDLHGDDEGDLEDASRADNSLLVVRAGTNGNPVDPDASLDGFTIRDGHRDDSADEGAGIYVPPGSNPTLSNLIVTRNRVSNGEFGGGLLVRSEFGSLVPALTVSNCRFVDNKAGQGGGVALALYARADFEFCEFDANAAHGLGGGGLLVYESSVADLTDCVVYGNTFTYGGGSPQGGGGLLAFKVCTLTMRRVRFESNRSLSSRGGGMVISEFSNVNFATDCQWIDNTAEMDEGGFGGVGGAVVFYNNANGNVGRFFNCLFQGNRAIPVPSQQSLGGGFYIEVNDAVEMTNCLFFDQTASLGAGIYASNVAPIVVNCTITENAADVAGGGIYSSNSSLAPILRNTIVWNNSANSVVDTNAQLHLNSPNSTQPDIEFFCLQGTPTWPSTLNSNINSDPTFSDPANDNFRLDVGSPCIDEGDNPSVPADIGDVNEANDTAEPVPLDLDFLNRFADPTGLPDELDNCEGIVDMGAFEFRLGCPGCEPFGDLSGDGLVNGLDIQPFVDCFLEQSDGCECLCGDFVGRDGVQLNDVGPFVNCLLSLGDECEPESCDAPGQWLDCNDNDLPDSSDIALCSGDPDCSDCDRNGVPDECDIADCASDPDCGDVNENGIPDGCE